MGRKWLSNPILKYFAHSYDQNVNASNADHIEGPCRMSNHGSGRHELSLVRSRLGQNAAPSDAHCLCAVAPVIDAKHAQREGEMKKKLLLWKFD